MKKNIFCGGILIIATVFFVMELTRHSQQDCSIGRNQSIDQLLLD